MTLTPAYLFPDTSIVIVTPQASTTVRLRPAPLNGGFFGVPLYQFRTSVAPFTIGATTGDPGIAAVTPAQAVVSGGTGQLEFQVQAVATGSTNLTFHVPDPYIGPPALGVTATGGQLFLFGSGVVGKDLQGAFSVTRTTVTVTSSDPSRLLVSASPDTPGQAAVTVGQGAVYAQGLADSGTVRLTATAAGFQSATADVVLAPAAAVFGSNFNIPPLSTLSAPVSLTVLLQPGSNSQGVQQPRRPGAPILTVPIRQSDPTVGAVTPAQLTFRPGDSSASFSFQPRAAGADLISLDVPAGFSDPLSARQLLLNVIAPRLVLSGSLSVGKDLQAPITANLAGVAGQPIVVTLASADPARLELGGPAATPGPTVALNFATAGSDGIRFTLAGLASSGSVTINATAAGLPATSYSVTLQPSGFRFTVPSVSVPKGTSSVAQIVSSMLAPGALTPAGDYALRSDIGAPVPVTVTSSDSSIVSVPAGPVFFSAGDSQASFTISGKSPGVATLTIAAPPGWSVAAGVSKMTVIVQ